MRNLISYFGLLAVLLLPISVSAMDGERAQKIIQAYGETLLEVTDYLVVDVRRLPYSKGEIEEAILFVMPLVDKQMCGYLTEGYLQLGMFQNIREIRMLKLPDNIRQLSDEEILGQANRYRLEPDWLPINEFVLDSMRRRAAEVPKC